MEPGFFLYIAYNTGDGFSYEILSVDTVNKIPKHRNPITLIRNVVRSQVVDSSHAPSCVESKAAFKFYNRPGDELFGTEEEKYSPYILNPTYTSSKFEPCLTPTIRPISQKLDMYVDEHAIDKPLSLSNTLF